MRSLLVAALSGALLAASAQAANEGLSLGDARVLLAKAGVVQGVQFIDMAGRLFRIEEMTVRAEHDWIVVKLRPRLVQ